MGIIPVNIKKIKMNDSLGLSSEKEEFTRYLFQLHEKGQQWDKTIICGRDDLLKLRNEIDTILESTSTAEVLRITEDQARVVDEHYKDDSLCSTCAYKLTPSCKQCLFVLQSPLERQLYLELLKSYISFQPQYPLNWYGKSISVAGKTYRDKHNNFKEVMTIVDFYIEKRDTKLCVYTDGHTYHERTEDQALRDRNIDRKLQELGFKVLRYTGKEVRDDTTKIVSDIKKWIE
ncbi:Protein of unknown function [Catalinimonas alkaloidigena]|uniref:DUF559 domain-containing protein n=1 Tax=Catalinimonas alkaloidigena TaxID=1075417 RepID=A0A1G9BUP0_9BACT|nr:DUF559 domain-containing protein [Catalinimonas alkaloidigena]SDK43169.1 Protein of unknown function [Catalinimonas alkaloidigena]